ncbi:hypothetical protein O3G_MSEX011000 [Manduca sexta]|uniref:Protein-cysteine N-palmitoyltransferase Rasp n=1 Tax=Manduca sexta TaxID=7130 RepID=A0A921ZJ89_MANSE|nr:hypothetical protein O3G_MSEX011000 [Manduca sexta]
MNGQLILIERVIYFCVWISVNIFSLYKLIIAQNEILDKHPQIKYSLRDLSHGWSFVSRLRDISDVEWSTWKYFIQTSWYYLVTQFIISELIRNTKTNFLKYWYILSSIIFIAVAAGLKQLLIITAQPVIFAIIIFSGGKKISVWLTSIVLLLSYNSLKYKYFFWRFLDDGDLLDEEVYLILFAVAWIELRCISFSIDYVERQEKLQNAENKGHKTISKYNEAVNMFSYVLYSPLLHIGPIMLYEDYEKSFTIQIERLSTRLKRFSFDIMLFLIYTFLLDLAFHYIYFFAMQSNIEAIKMLPTLALCGGGLWMGLEFHMKYVITYGTTAAFSRLDNMEPPPTPRCIVRIHVYSLMWRYFDVGLYKFLVKYIYKPGYNTLSKYVKLSKIGYKLIASLATFLFIFLWHGTVWNIFVWSALNYIGILLEYTGKAISETETYKFFKKAFLRSDEMEIRFIAFLCSPLLALSAISSFYLFAGSEVGDLFFGLLNGPTFYNCMIVGLSLYCCCQVSIALKDVPSRTDVPRSNVKHD